MRRNASKKRAPSSLGAAGFRVDGVDGTKCRSQQGECTFEPVATPMHLSCVTSSDDSQFIGNVAPPHADQLGQHHITPAHYARARVALGSPSSTHVATERAPPYNREKLTRAYEAKSCISHTLLSRHTNCGTRTNSCESVSPRWPAWVGSRLLLFSPSPRAPHRRSSC